MDCFDLDGSRGIDQEEFLDFVWKWTPTPEIGSIGVMMRERLSRHDVQDMRDTFTKLDSKRRIGGVHQKDFTRVVRNADRELDREEVDELVRAFSDPNLGGSKRDRVSRDLRDDDDQDQVCWVHFLAWLEAGMVERVMSRVKRRLARRQTQGFDSRKLFERADRDGNGQMDKREFEALLWKCGLALSYTQYEALWRQVDRDNRGYLSLKEFETLLDGNVKKARRGGAVLDGVDMGNWEEVRVLGLGLVGSLVGEEAHARRVGVGER